MAKRKRSYTQPTLKVLFALSGNQCAHPDCSSRLIQPSTEFSDALVSAQICHIDAISPGGPRGTSGMSEKELNSPDNLILLCPDHHALVDGQPKDYPAATLRNWKKTHEAEVAAKITTDTSCIQPDILSHPYFPRDLVNQRIADEVDLLRRSRFFAEYDRAWHARCLARRVMFQELSGGSEVVKGHALAWCARVLTDFSIEEAEQHFASAKTLNFSHETDIADAFVQSKRGETKTALAILSRIDIPLSRSAAFMIVGNNEGAEAAVDWLATAGFRASDLDPDGRLVFLTRQLALARWNDALATTDSISDDDLRTTPALYHLVALTHLVQAVPPELRPTVLSQLPFEAAGFPLASDPSALDARRKARVGSGNNDPRFPEIMSPSVGVGWRAVCRSSVAFDRSLP